MKPPQSLHYIPCQTETSIAETGRERERRTSEQARRRRRSKRRRWALRKFSGKKCIKEYSAEYKGVPVQRL